jgi:LPS sulfotransferase NodH
VHDLDSLNEAYDQPPHDGGPRRLLFICTTPRTGSHRLARALYDLGLGIPSEYFHTNTLDVLGARWGLAGDRQSPGWLDGYWREVLRRRTRNGVVAVSIFGNQLGILKRVIGSAEQPILIYLYRRSAADQITSLLALYQTKMPYENQKIMANIPDIGEVSPRSIRILHQWLAQQNRKWRAFLADRPHLATSSEEFFAQPAEILRAILSHGQVDVLPSRFDEAAQFVRSSRAYSINAGIKRQFMLDHAASFAALEQDIDRAKTSARADTPNA